MLIVSNRLKGSIWILEDTFPQNKYVFMVTIFFNNQYVIIDLVCTPQQIPQNNQRHPLENAQK